MRPAAPLLALLTLAGCGGHGGGSSSGSSASATNVGKGKGRAVLKISWPARSNARLVPNAANSIVVRLTLGTTVVATKTIPRPAAGQTTTSTTLTGLKYGAYTVAVNAYPTTTGTGTAQAVGAGTMAVTEDAPGSLAVAMDSTVVALALVPAAPALALGSSAPVAVSATDATGAIVLLASGGSETVAWTSDAPSVVSVSGTGPVATLAGVALGIAHVSATLRVKDDGTTVSSSPGVVTVHDAAAYKLAVGGYPKTGGDAGNTGLAGGSGATGAVGWSASVGTAAVGAVVVGTDGTVYTGAGGTVSAISSSGAVLWQKSVAGTVAGMLLTAGGRIYVGSDLLSALNVADGSVAWSFATSGACYAPNVLADGTVVQATPSTVYAIDPETQAVRWQASFACSSGAAVESDDTVVLWNGGEVRGLVGASGAQSFSQAKVATVSPPPASMFTLGQRFSVSGSFGFSAAPCARGNVVAYPEAAYAGSATCIQGLISGGQGGLHPGYFYSYNIIDSAYLRLLSGGSVTSTSLASAATTNVIANLVPAPTALAEDTTGQYLLSYPTKTASTKGWSVAENGSAGASVGADGTVYLATKDSPGKVEAIDPTSGTVLWTATLPAAGTGARPALGPGGSVYVGTTDGQVVQIR